MLTSKELMCTQVLCYLEGSLLSEAPVGEESTKRRTLAGILIAVLLIVYGIITIINLQMAIEHIGTYIYGNALILFLFTGLPAIVVGLIIAVIVYRRR